MATTYKDVDIICPFYKEHIKCQISCEGITDDSLIKLWFNSPKAKAFHQEVYCENRYKYCEIYRMLEKKYEE